VLRYSRVELKSILSALFYPDIVRLHIEVEPSFSSWGHLPHQRIRWQYVSYGGDTTHTNTYGGTTSGAYGAGAVHTAPNGTTTYAASAYHPPSAYYGYHPPTTVNYYGAGCYNCDGSTAGAAVAGAAVGVAVGAAVASANTSAATANAYNAGYTAGAVNTSAAQAVYSPGAIVVTLPAGCSSPNVRGQTYYLCGNTWFSPAYGANGVYYRVVPTP
jgi:hypothetical protein